MDDIRAAVIDDLTFDPDVDANRITVDVTGSQVTLGGSVPSYPQYVQAAAVAGRVPGVQNVRNGLAVALPPGDERADAALAAAANSALTLGHSVPERVAGVEATAQDGDITLTGTVGTDTERAAAEAVVAGLTGVRSVTNDIRLAVS